MKLSNALLIPISLLGSALVATVILTAFLNNDVSAANGRARLASRQMVLGSEIRSLSRAIQRDALKMILSTDAAERQVLSDSTAKRKVELTGKAQALVRLLSTADAATLAGFADLQQAVMSRIDSVKALASAGRGPDAYAEMRSLVKPAEKAASAPLRSRPLGAPRSAKSGPPPETLSFSPRQDGSASRRRVGPSRAG